MSASATRITIEPGKRGGKPCIRGLRITVWDVLGWLGSGMTEEQVLDEHPDIEKDDFPAVYQFAAEASKAALHRCLGRLKAATDDTEIRRLTEELQRIVFHKQYRDAED